MSCYYPLQGYRTPDGVVFSELSRHDILGSIEIPCGQCIGCRMRRASDWTLRCMHEASLHKTNCFVTLTYARDRLPPGASLDHRDYQLFLKRLRKQFHPHKVRYYMCGEYGPLNLRPHFHANLFGINFSDRIPAGKSASGAVYYSSPTLDKLWGLGRASVQDLTAETAGYCARYIMKKQLGRDSEKHYESVDADGVLTRRKPEYAAMSLRPGIGHGWFKKFGGDVYPHDFVIAGGSKKRPPAYYDKLLKRSDQAKLEEVQFARELRGRAAHADNTDERRRVRDQVHQARVATLKRNDL